jgi:DNA polymerase-1
MIHADAAVRSAGLRARLLLTVHDELLFETPRDEVEPLAAIVRETMEGAMPLSVPLVVDVKVGDDWESMTPLTRADEIAAEADELPLESPVAPLAS